MPILESNADFREKVRLGRVKLPVFPIRHCRNTWMPREYTLKDKIEVKMSLISKY